MHSSLEGHIPTGVTMRKLATHSPSRSDVGRKNSGWVVDVGPGGHDFVSRRLHLSCESLRASTADSRGGESAPGAGPRPDHSAFPGARPRLTQALRRSPRPTRRYPRRNSRVIHVLCPRRVFGQSVSTCTSRIRSISTRPSPRIQSSPPPRGSLLGSCWVPLTRRLRPAEEPCSGPRRGFPG